MLNFPRTFLSLRRLILILEVKIFEFVKKGERWMDVIRKMISKSPSNIDLKLFYLFSFLLYLCLVRFVRGLHSTNKKVGNTSIMPGTNKSNVKSLKKIKIGEKVSKKLKTSNDL
jgi:hypothetical protein